MNRRIVTAIAAALTLTGATDPALSGPMFGTDAGPADLNDPASYLENPALTLLTINQAAFGYQILHLGVLEEGSLASGFFTYTARFDFGGIGLGLNMLTTPGWSEKQFRAAYSRRIWNGISLGIRVGLYQHGFDKNAFRIVDTDDPLLVGSLIKTLPTLAVGAIYADPFSRLTLGLVVDDPHSPSTSLDGSDPEARRPMTIRAGVGLENDTYQGSLFFSTSSHESRFVGVGRAFWFWDHALTARFSTHDWSLGARIAIHSAFWLDYSFALPLSDLAGESSGTHGLVLCFRAFDRPKPPPEYAHRPLLRDQYLLDPPAHTRTDKPRAETITFPLLPSHADLYYVEASTDRAAIKTKRLHRQFGHDVDLAMIRRLPRWRIGVLDTTWSDRVAYYLGEDAQPAAPRDGLPRGNYSERYRERIDQLGGFLDTDASGTVHIVADSTQLDRAKFLKEQILKGAGDDDRVGDRNIDILRMAPLADPDLHAHLFSPVGDDPLPPIEEITLYSPDHIQFNVSFLGQQQSITRWSLQLHDSEDLLIWETSDSGPPPETLTWDLRGQDGHRVDVDHYHYAFSWWKADGAHYRLPAQEIAFERYIQVETFEFGHGIVDPSEIRRSRPIIILDPGRTGEVLIPGGAVRHDQPAVLPGANEETIHDEQPQELPDDAGNPDAGRLDDHGRTR